MTIRPDSSQFHFGSNHLLRRQQFEATILQMKDITLPDEYSVLEKTDKGMLPYNTQELKMQFVVHSSQLNTVFLIGRIRLLSMRMKWKEQCFILMMERILASRGCYCRYDIIVVIRDYRTMSISDHSPSSHYCTIVILAIIHSCHCK